MNIAFGKYKGRAITSIDDIKYLEWLSRNLDPNLFNNKQLLIEIDKQLKSEELYSAPTVQEDNEEWLRDRTDFGALSGEIENL